MRVVRRKHILALTIWGLLSLWGAFGGLALAEQLEMVLDSGEQETQTCELALAGLEQALKPEAAYSVGQGADSLALSIVIDIPSPTIVREGHVSRSAASPRIDLSSVRLHQLLSIYRI